MRIPRNARRTARLLGVDAAHEVSGDVSNAYLRGWEDAMRRVLPLLEAARNVFYTELISSGEDEIRANPNLQQLQRLHGQLCAQTDDITKEELTP